MIRPIVKSYLPETDTTEEDDDLATRFKDGELSDEELELIELGDEESLEDIKAKLKPKNLLYRQICSILQIRMMTRWHW